MFAVLVSLFSGLLVFVYFVRWTVGFVVFALGCVCCWLGCSFVFLLY